MEHYSKAMQSLVTGTAAMMEQQQFDMIVRNNYPTDITQYNTKNATEVFAALPEKDVQNCSNT